MAVSNEKKEIVLKDIDPFHLEHFDLTGAAGRDLIAEQIKTDIDEFCVQTMVDADGFRAHLGASAIGHECDRYLWFKFRWMAREKISAREARLFNRGHLEEDRVISWLRGIGFNVVQVTEDGKQIRIADLQGHFGGSCDGNFSLPARFGPLVQGIKFLLEVKTVNSKGFENFAQGVVKANPRYWAQMCTYGLKLGINYALFIVVGKNNDDIEVELLQLDEALGYEQLEKAKRVIESTTPPPRISETPSFWKCRFCEFAGVCHLNEQPDRNCRSCYFAQPVEDGQWRCNNFNSIIPVEFLLKGCDQWHSLPH